MADAAREFYNNVLDGSVGLRIVPDFGVGLQVLGEYHRGQYWDATLPTAPYGRWFSSGRLMVVLDQPFAF